MVGAFASPSVTDSAHRARRLLAGRDVPAVAAVLVALVALARVTSVRALQIPGYLVMVGFDLVQNPLLPGLGRVGFYLLYAVYVYALAVVVALALRRTVLARYRAGSR